MRWPLLVACWACVWTTAVQRLSCQTLTCGPPGQSTGSQYSPVQPHYVQNETVHYECRNSDQLLLGASSRRCLPTGRWDSPQPKCGKPITSSSRYSQDNVLVLSVRTAQRIAGLEVRLHSAHANLKILEVRYLARYRCTSQALYLEDVAQHLFTFRCSSLISSASELDEGNFVILSFNRALADCKQACAFSSKLFRMADGCDRPDLPLYWRFRMDSERRKRADESSASSATTVADATVVTTSAAANTSEAATDKAIASVTSADSGGSTSGNATSNATSTTDPTSKPGSTAVEATATPSSETTASTSATTESASPATSTSASTAAVTTAETSHGPSTAEQKTLRGTFDCLAGFTLDEADSTGLFVGSCDAGSGWIYPTLPSCRPKVTCNLPTTAFNVRPQYNQSYTATRFLVGQELHFACVSRDEVNVGAPVKICEPDGSWSRPDARCVSQSLVSKHWWLFVGSTVFFGLSLLILVVSLVCSCRWRAWSRQPHRYDLRSNFSYLVPDDQFRAESTAVARRDLPRLPEQPDALYESVLNDQAYLELEQLRGVDEPAGPRFATINKKSKKVKDSGRQRVSEGCYVEPQLFRASQRQSEAKQILYGNDYLFDS